jgi:hypothetical protein
MVRCISPEGAYNFVENNQSEKIELHQDEYYLLTLGNRFSGTNVFGELPKEPLKVGNRLGQLSASGIVGQCHYVPSWYSGKVAEHEIVGFLCKNKNIINLRDLVPQNFRCDLGSPITISSVFVGGSSAEVGKTTFSCRLISNLKKTFPDVKISAIKATGTGRTKDLNSYVRVGADIALDYVDLGYPSTYGISSQEFNIVLRQLLKLCEQESGLAVVELGGDLLEANVPEALIDRCINSFP